MESIGEYLRRKRELRGLSLREISDRTKIGMNYLSYIEENRFDKIPGEVFVKGFLRLYASSIGLKEEDVIELYHSQYKGIEKKESIDPKIQKNIHLKFSLWLWSIPVLLIAILFLNGLAQKDKPHPVPSKVENAVTKPEHPPILSEDLPQRLTLSIEAIEETWIKILIDGKEVKETLLRSGERVSFDAENNFGLTVGNAGGVKINFDGKELESLGPRGKVVRDFILSKDIQVPITNNQ